VGAGSLGPTRTPTSHSRTCRLRRRPPSPRPSAAVGREGYQSTSDSHQCRWSVRPSGVPRFDERPAGPAVSPQHEAGHHSSRNPSDWPTTKSNPFQRGGGTLRVLHLFSGRADRPDGLAAHLKSLGWDCDDVDVVNTYLPGPQRSDHDLLDDELWLSIHKWLRDRMCDFVWLGAPCATFSAARWQLIPGNPNACRPLRAFGYPGGYERRHYRSRRRSTGRRHKTHPVSIELATALTSGHWTVRARHTTEYPRETQPRSNTA
jgi:hypothetical protein